MSAISPHLQGIIGEYPKKLICCVYFCVIGRKITLCVNKSADELATAVAERMHPAVRISSSVCRPPFVKAVVNTYGELMNSSCSYCTFSMWTGQLKSPNMFRVRRKVKPY